MRLQTDELIWNECLTTKRIGRKTITHLNNITRSNVTANKVFWKLIKLFLKNNDSAGNNDITLSLRKEFNMDFMNIVEKVEVS